MKKTILLAGSLLLMTQVTFSQSAGEKTFKTVCSACHSVGKGKLVGPDLSGVTGKYDEKWLISFIKSSQSMVKKGDPKAVKAFNDNAKIVMPDQNLTDLQIKEVLNYIKTNSKSKTTAKPAATPVKTSLSEPVKKEHAVNTQVQKKSPVVNVQPSEHSIISIKVQNDVDPRDLNNAVWNNCKPQIIKLGAQNVVAPMLRQESIPELQVKSVYTGKTVVFLLEWADSTKDNRVDVDKFCDQVAIQIPVDPNDPPSYMMGNSGGKVHLVHWKSVWQEDCQNGFYDVQNAYPNMWVDIYPGEENELDRSRRMFAKDVTAEHMVETRNTNTLPATYAGNPIACIKRKEPVEEATAEGYGKYTTQEVQAAKGWAEWKDNKWKVCIVVPVNTGNTYKSVVDDKTKVAFAVWNGNNQNIGGRKHFAPWSDLILQK